MKTIAIGLGVLVMVAVARGDVRGEFLKMIERPRGELKVVVRPMADAGGGHFTFESSPGRVVPGILMEPSGVEAGKKYAVVIALHGTGGNKEGEVAFLRKVVARGFIGVAIDGPYHGERCALGKGTVDYEAAIVKAFGVTEGETGKEHPFYYDTVWDVMRLIDYLETRPDVDGGKIGLYGVSKGGIETYLTAAMDERVAVAVPCIGLESFGWAVKNEKWGPRTGTIPVAFAECAKLAGVEKVDGGFVHLFYERVCPGVDGEFDGPAVVGMIAPRPLMAINGETDAKTPAESLKLCVDAAEKAYGEKGVPEKFVVRVEGKTGHKVTAESEDAAMAWFERWLKR